MQKRQPKALRCRRILHKLQCNKKGNLSELTQIKSYTIAANLNCCQIEKREKNIITVNPINVLPNTEPQGSFVRTIDSSIYKSVRRGSFQKKLNP